MRRLLVASLFACAIGCGGGPSPAPSPAEHCSAHLPVGTPARAEASLLWSYQRPEEPEPNSVALGSEHRYVFVGRQQFGGLMFEVGGEGEPLWSFAVGVGSLSTAAAVDDDVFYGVAGEELPDEPADLRVARFRATESQPVWIYEAGAAGFIPGNASSPAMQNRSPIASTPDGHLLAVVGAKNDRFAISFFDANAPEPLGTYVSDAPGEERLSTPVQLTADGSKFFYSTGGILYRRDVMTQALEASLNFHYGLAVASRDGERVVRLDNNLLIAYRWTGTSYEQFWEYNPNQNGFTDIERAAAVAFTADGARVVVAWEHEGMRQVSIIAFSLDQEECATWSYTTPEGAEGNQDVVSGLKMSDDGEWVAVGTWGTKDNAHPEFFLLRASDPREPFFALDTPGSVNSIDMAADGSTIVVGARSVHNNAFGYGSSIYAVRVTSR